jgi:diacylglycerol kinase family enzyme
MTFQGARKHLLILNPRSFRRSREIGLVIASIESCFESLGHLEYELYVSRYPRDAIGIIHTSIRSIPNTTIVRVYALGGDGILFDCLNGIAGFENAELAVIPYGSTNYFIRSFGERKISLFRDIKAQAQAGILPTDIMKCKGNYAINFCTIGMEAEAAAQAQRMKKVLENGAHLFRRFYYGLSRYMYPLGRFFAAFNKKITGQWYEIKIDEEILSGNFRNITIANGPCHKGKKIIPSNIVPDDGILDIVIGRSSGLLKTLSFISPFFRDNYEKHPSDFIVKQGKKISIRSNLPLSVNLDDETFYDTDFTVELIPAAAKIAAAYGFSYTRRSESRETGR